MLSLISHKIENARINQRIGDGYMDATAMCEAVKKRFHDYRRLAVTEAFLNELARSTGIPVDLLVIVVNQGVNEMRGTWVHPKVAVNLGQWCSPEFAVAVSGWVLDWAEKRAQSNLPYHLERYLLNNASVPAGHFSMLAEMAICLIGPMEAAGYTIPEHLVPDISEGQIFCKWLRTEKGVDTDSLPTYICRYQDGRAISAKAYPLALLPDLRAHFANEWLPNQAQKYFKARDPKALEFLPKLLPAPVAAQTPTAKTFADIKRIVANRPPKQT